MAAPTPIAIDAPLPPTVKRQYSFTDFSQNNPTTPPLGNRMDAEYDRINVALNSVINFCSEVKQLAPALTDVTGSTQVVGADLLDLEQDYVVTAQAWAEHMPDTIPPNILATMNVTGDHWSSRWWSNRAAQLIENWANLLPPGPANTVRYIYVATPGQTLFHGPDRAGQTLAWDPTHQQALQVFKRGLLLTPVDDYADNVANQVTLNLSATAGDIVQVFVITLPPAWSTPITVTVAPGSPFTPPTGANYVFLVEAPGGVTLPLGNGRISGQMIVIKDNLGTASTNRIVIQAAATIDSNPTYNLVSDYASLTLIWLGTMWGTL